MIEVLIPACNAARIFPAARAAKLPQSTPRLAVIGLSATLAMLAPGAHVIITAARQPDGSLVAQKFGVGKDGLVPPM